MMIVENWSGQRKNTAINVEGVATKVFKRKASRRVTTPNQLRELDEYACLEFYKSHLEHARLHEIQRERATRSILVIVGVLLGLLSLKTSIGSLDIPLCLSIVGLGVCGLFTTTAHTWKQEEHHKRATLFYSQIMETNSASTIIGGQSKNLQNRARSQAAVLAKRVKKRRSPTAHKRWLVINGLTILFGTVALLMCPG